MFLDSKTFGKIKNSLTSNLEKEIFITLNEEAVPEIKEIILRNYQTLALYRMHKDSKLKLTDFYDKLVDLLDNYLFIEVEDSSISLKVPNVVDIESSRVEELKVLLVIIEGLVGRYIELEEKEVAALGLSISNGIVFEINNKKIFLFKRTAALDAAMKGAGIQRKSWPFSRPVDIFNDADEFVEDNMDRWLKHSIEKARRELIQEYK